VRSETAAASPIFAALGDATRLGLVRRLSREGPLSIARLAEGSPVSRQAVSKHLRVLAGAGLASPTRSGRERVWALEPESLDAARAYLDGLAAQWDESLGRLKRLVERHEG
jgi:DNA-binding transcriptional ArsR family regulator